jgi:hypothetical protein
MAVSPNPQSRFLTDRLVGGLTASIYEPQVDPESLCQQDVRLYRDVATAVHQEGRLDELKAARQRPSSSATDWQYEGPRDELE